VESSAGFLLLSGPIVRGFLNRDFRSNFERRAQVSEFDELAGRFDVAWAAVRSAKTAAGTARQRRPGGGRKGCLVSAEQKLFFILLYFKAYPTQDVMGLLFGITQGQVSEWVRQLIEPISPFLKRNRLFQHQDQKPTSVSRPTSAADLNRGTIDSVPSPDEIATGLEQFPRNRFLTNPLSAPKQFASSCLAGLFVSKNSTPFLLRNHGVYGDFSLNSNGPPSASER
jgi:hypothetical protein